MDNDYIRLYADSWQKLTSSVKIKFDLDLNKIYSLGAVEGSVILDFDGSKVIRDKIYKYILSSKDDLNISEIKKRNIGDSYRIVFEGK